MVARTVPPAVMLYVNSRLVGHAKISEMPAGSLPFDHPKLKDTHLLSSIAGNFKCLQDLQAGAILQSQRSSDGLQKLWPNYQNQTPVFDDAESKRYFENRISALETIAHIIEEVSIEIAALKKLCDDDLAGC